MSLSSNTLFYQLPEVYQHLLPKTLLSFEIYEVKATCSQCAMALGKAQKNGADADKWYNPSLKCCTYQPFLPNYLLGGILKSSSRGVIESQITQKDFMLPLGGFPSVKYQIAFNAKNPADFGRKSEFLCSYYDKKTELCKIWKYRNSVCSTYHCFSIYNEKGISFWLDLQEYLFSVETTLAEYCMEEGGFNPQQVWESLDFLNGKGPESLEADWNELTAESHQELWQNWVNKESEFYIQSYEIVKSLDRKKFREIMGSIGKKHSNLMTKQISQLMELKKDTVNANTE